MTVFVDGKPLKRDYRHFKLRDMQHADDYGSMDQVLRRRFARLLEGDEKFGAQPDLLLIDGGANHANVALRVLQDVGLDIPVFGMVKDDRHRTRGLISPQGEELGLSQNQGVFSLVGRIQEETHRFAIEFNRLQASKRIKGSQLDVIPGVVEKRRTQLLKAFGSVKKIKEASLAQLEEAVPKSTAKAVFTHFHPVDECKEE